MGTLASRFAELCGLYREFDLTVFRLDDWHQYSKAGRNG